MPTVTLPAGAEAPAPPLSTAVRAPRWPYVNRLIAGEISTLTRYFDRVVQLDRSPHDSGALLSLIECAAKASIEIGERFEGDTDPGARSAFLLNGTFNSHLDIQGLLEGLAPRIGRHSRLIVVAYNPYLEWLYRLADLLKLRSAPRPTTFVTHIDLSNLARLSGFELVRERPAVYLPWRCLGLGNFLNRMLPLVPGLRALGLVSLLVLRKVPGPDSGLRKPSLTVVIPARNERGNIESAVSRLPDLGAECEVIFVEGHSSDGTWEEIERVRQAYSGPLRIRSFRQEGRGKGDAVRLGFSHARGELLTILDADLTMPPELLGRFYDAYLLGHADFVNGSRLVYPMEGEAMRFLNRLGNVFFAKALSWVLGVRLGDSLCGTKLLAKRDYERVLRWRTDFGEFDPFGDFELLFPAAVLGLGIVDIPIRYRSRTYGMTNISRFRHGWMLLKMTAIGLFRIKMGRV